MFVFLKNRGMIVIITSCIVSRITVDVYCTDNRKLQFTMNFSIIQSNYVVEIKPLNKFTIPS